MFTGSLAFGWPHDILHMVGSRAHHDQRIAPAPPRLRSQPAVHRCPAHGRYNPHTRIRAMVSPTTTTPNASPRHLPTRFVRNAGHRGDWHAKRSHDAQWAVYRADLIKAPRISGAAPT